MSSSYPGVYEDIAERRLRTREQARELERPGTPVPPHETTDPFVTGEHARHEVERRLTAGELREHEAELGEEEERIREYERKGYSIKETDEGYEFTKKGRSVRGDYSVTVTWQDSSGNVHVVGTQASKIDNIPGRILEVKRIGGGAVYQRGGETIAEDKVIYKAEPQPEQVQPQYYYEHEGEKKPLPPPVKGLPTTIQQGIWNVIMHQETGVPLGEYHAPGSRRYLGQDKQISLGFGKVVHKPIPKTVEQQAGIQAGLTSGVVSTRKAVAIEEYQRREYEAWQEQQHKWESAPAPVQFLRKGTAHWLAGFPNIEYLQAWWDKDWETTERIAESWEYGVWQGGGRRGDMPRAFATGYPSTAMFRNVIVPASAVIGLGAGLGSLSAVYPTVGKWTGRAILGYGAYETGKSLIEDPFGTGVYLATTLPFMIPMFKSGYRFGYGRTETYLYKIHTYKPGTPEWVRFDQALKVGRILEGVKSHKMKPLDFAKDIMRMDKTTADQFLSYYAAHKGVVGGSAASYTQIVGARQPRDVDYFMQRFLRSTDPLVKSAKKILPTKKTIFVHGKLKKVHRIDIHGKELYKPGLYHRFGFVSKQPLKIDGVKYFKAGEQLFRKGVASIVSEKAPRWPKDVPDFVTHAESLISTLRMKTYNPFAQWKATKAEQALSLFLDPSASPTYGKPLGTIGQFIKATTTPIEPVATISPFGVIDYLYPKSAYPSYSVGASIAGYYPGTQQPYDVPLLGGYKTTPIDRYISPPVVEGYPQPSVKKETVAIPGKYPSAKKTITSVISYLEKPYPKPSPYKAGHPPIETFLSYPPTQLPSYPPGKPSGYPSGKPPSQPPPDKGIGTTFGELLAIEDQQAYAVMVKDRYIVHGKKKYEERFIKLSKYPLTEADAMGFGATVTNESAAATFYIKPIKGKPQKPSIPITSWGMLSNLFYRRDGKYIERTVNRINTPGEINEISARGWVAQKRKLHPKPKKMKKINIVPRDLRSAILSDKFFKIPKRRSLF